MTQIERLTIWTLLVVALLVLSIDSHILDLHDARITNIEMAK